MNKTVSIQGMPKNSYTSYVLFSFSKSMLSVQNKYTLSILQIDKGEHNGKCTYYKLH